MKNVKLFWRLSGYFLIAALFFGFGNTLRAQDTYTKITSITELTDGDYLIGSTDGTKVLGYQNTNNRPAATTKSSNGSINATAAKETSDQNSPYEITITKKSDGIYTLVDKVAEKHLHNPDYAGKNNYLRCSDDEVEWTIDIASTGVATIKMAGVTGRNWLRFNNTLFACYSSGQSDVSLYKKEIATTEPFVKTDKNAVSYKILPTENLNETLSFTAGNLENDLTVSVASATEGKAAVIAVDKTTVGKETTAFDLRLTTSGLVEGEYSDIITLKSGAETMATVTVNLTVELNYPYKKITTNAELTAGTYLIVYEDAKDATKNAAAADIESGKSFIKSVSVVIAEEEIAEKGTAHEFYLESTSGGWTIKDVEKNQYLKTTGASNATMAYDGTAFNWTMAFDNDGICTVTSSGEGHGPLQYNTSSPRFANYTNGKQSAIQLYKKQVPEVPATCDKVTLPSDGGVTPGQTDAEIIWNAPAKAPANGYKVTVKGAGYEESKTTTETHIEWPEELAPETTYTYSIVSLCGEDLESDPVESTFTTLAADAPSIDITSPANNRIFSGDVEFAFTTENFELGESKLVKAEVKAQAEDQLAAPVLKTLYTKASPITISGLADGKYHVDLYLANVDGNDTTVVNLGYYVHRNIEVKHPAVYFSPENLKLSSFVGVAVSGKVQVSGWALPENASVSFASENKDFTVTPATLTQAEVMAEGGAEIIVTYNGAEAAVTAAITASCGDITATLTVTVANEAVAEVANIAALRAGEVGKNYKLTGEVVVSDVNQSTKFQNIWIQDATGGMLVYIDTTLSKKRYACETGDKLANIYGKLANYNGLLELTYIADLPAAASHNNKVDTALVTVTELKAGLNTYCSKLVRLSGLTLRNKEGQWSNSVNDTALDAAGNIVIIRPTAATRDYIKEEKPQGTFDLVALVGVYNGTIQVSPRYKTDIISLRASVAKPTFNLKADSLYEEAQMLTIACATEGAKIYYTTNGTTPTAASTQYTAPIKIEKNTTVKAIAVMDDMDNSPVATISIRFKVVIRGELVFHEYFEKLDSSINNEIKKVDSVFPGWSGTKVYPGGQCLKLGTGSAKGSLTLPKIDLSYDNGTYFVVFTAQAWVKDATEINLIANGQTEIVSGLDNTSSQYDVAHRKEYVFEFNNGTEETEITFEAIKASSNRFFLDSIRIYQVVDAPSIVVPATLEMSTVLGTPVSQKVTVKGMLLESDVTVTCPTGNFSVEPATLAKENVMSENGAEFTVTFNATKAADTVELTLTSGELTKIIKVTATAEVSSANEGVAELACRLYPNPTSGTFYVETAEAARMEIFTLGGVMVCNAELMAGKNEIRLDQSGIYFVRLTNGIAATVRRVVVR